jgi:hypothetical protein
MNSFEAYKKYIAIKSHFSSNYDYFKYRGKMKITHETYLKRKDKFFFERLAKKYKDDEIEEILFCNFVSKDDFWIGQNDMFEIYEEWKKRIRSISYNLREEINRINDYTIEKQIKFIHLFKTGDNYPELLTLYSQKHISIELMSICDDIFNYMNYWNKQYNNDLILQHQTNKIVKYKPFIIQKIDREKIKKLIKENLL